MKRICVFCGARSGNKPVYAQAARDAALAIVAAGYGIVFGGGRVGLMGILADTALEAGGEVVGVIPSALASREIAHHGVTKLHVVADMHERKAMMADASDGFIALAGGYGTMEEFAEILTWRQLGIHDKPIGLVNTDGFYDQLIGAIDRMTDDGFVTAENRTLFRVEPTIEALLPGFV
jgi:uncharacterized protein (TIGR00730 family)